MASEIQRIIVEIEKLELEESIQETNGSSVSEISSIENTDENEADELSKEESNEECVVLTKNEQETEGLDSVESIDITSDLIVKGTDTGLHPVTQCTLMEHEKQITQLESRKSYSKDDHFQCNRTRLEEFKRNFQKFDPKTGKMMGESSENEVKASDELPVEMASIDLAKAYPVDTTKVYSQKPIAKSLGRRFLNGLHRRISFLLPASLKKSKRAVPEIVPESTLDNETILPDPKNVEDDFEEISLG